MLEQRPPRKAKGGGRPTGKESQSRLLMVQQVAKRNFLSVGYPETSLDEIARQSGIAKKTIYSRFGSKAGLFRAILDSLQRSWIAELEDIVIESKRPESVLEAAALHLLDVGTRADMIELHRLLLIESRRFADLVDGVYGKQGRLTGMEPLSDYLRLAVEKGLLEIEDIPLATEQFVHLVLGGVRERIFHGVAKRPNAPSRTRVAKQAVKIFLTGCRV